MKEVRHYKHDKFQQITNILPTPIVPTKTSDLYESENDTSISINDVEVEVEDEVELDAHDNKEIAGKLKHLAGYVFPYENYESSNEGRFVNVKPKRKKNYHNRTV